MPQSFASLHVHIVFSTKHRQLFLNDELRLRLFEYIGGIARQHDCALISAGGMNWNGMSAMSGIDGGALPPRWGLDL
jgi:hypothetical protein